MADASYSSGVFTDNGNDSSRTDPITLSGLVAAAPTLSELSSIAGYQSAITDTFTGNGGTTYRLSHIQPSVTEVTVNGTVQTEGTTDDYTISGQDIVFTSGSTPASGANIRVTFNTGVQFRLASGNYNFSSAQLTLTGGGGASASRFEIGPATDATSATVLVGYDNIAIPSPNDFSHITDETFILNFEDEDFFPTSRIGVPGNWNYYVRNTAILDISERSRMIVNIPRRGPYTANLAGRNIFMLENNKAASNIRMTINMGRYANGVLYDNPPDTNTSNVNGGGPALGNSTQLYELTSAVPVRDVLYRGDYVDWRPRRFSSTWAPLTAGGFIGDNGIKWLIEDQVSSIISDTNPLTFGSFTPDNNGIYPTFSLGIRSNSELIPANGNGYFELGISPNTADIRTNRVVFRNVIGIPWRERLALWNNGRDRLRVEHHTVQPFHIFDDIQENIEGARVVVNHFYPTYASLANGTPVSSFEREVSSTALTTDNGRVVIGTEAGDYNANVSSTTTNRPLIIEAAERNNTALGTAIQSAYRVSTSSDSVGYSSYRTGASSSTNNITYDVYAYGHMPNTGNGISFSESGFTSGGPQSNIEVPLQRDINVTELVQDNVPTRAGTLENVYDMLSLWAFNNRTSHPVTVEGTTIRFGSRQVTFNTSTDVTNVVSVTDSTMNIPCNVEITTGGTGKFNSIQVTPMTGRPNVGFVANGVTFTGFSEVSASAPTINFNELNVTTPLTTLNSRLDIFDSTNNPAGPGRSLFYADGTTSRRLMSVTDGRGQLSINKGQPTFSQIGLGGDIDDITAVWSRPGHQPMIFEINVETANDQTFEFLEIGQPYPQSADITGFTASSAYDPATNVLTTTITNGSSRNTLSDTELNRLLVENTHGTEAGNEFLYVTALTTDFGSRDTNSYFFADSRRFQTAIASGVLRAGYIENLDRRMTAREFNMPVPVTANDGTVGARGVYHAEDPSAFNISAVSILNGEQTTEIQNHVNTQVNSLRSSDTNSTDTLSDIRNDIRATRNTIIGNL